MNFEGLHEEIDSEKKKLSEILCYLRRKTMFLMREIDELSVLTCDVSSCNDLLEHSEEMEEIAALVTRAIQRLTPQNTRYRLPDRDMLG